MEFYSKIVIVLNMEILRYVFKLVYEFIKYLYKIIKNEEYILFIFI